MLQILLLWLYISSVSVSIGYFVLKMCTKILKDQVDESMTHAIIAGMVTLTVYAQIFSIFTKVSALAHIVMLLVAVVLAIVNRKELWKILKNAKESVFSLEGLVYIGIILVCAFFTSRGTQHTDTSIYHAQAIRWLEEYGAVRGLGNLMGNYAYNSSWLCYTALFSMKFLGGLSYHTTNGYIMAVMCVYVIDGLWDFKKHQSHEADALRLGILFYAVVICVVAMSPATDAPSMFILLYIILRWCENLREGKQSLHVYAMLCVLIVYAVTLKLSTGMLVLLVILPAVMLIQSKNIKAIIIYIALGVVVLLPFLIRNVIISGWLLYPFEVIDLFNVEWKIPIENVIVDSQQIKVYGRKTYQNELINQSITEWFPVWWEESEAYDRGLLVAQFVGIFLMGISFLKGIISSKKVDWNLQLLNMTLIVCFASWVFTAPFVRYGLGIMVAIPLLAIAQYQETRRVSLYKVFAIGSIVLIVTCLAPYWNHYVMDSLLFVKQNLTQPYYIQSKDYDELAVNAYEVEGYTFYQAAENAMLSYHSFPGTGGNKRFGLLGDEIKDGFYTER